MAPRINEEPETQGEAKMHRLQSITGAMLYEFQKPCRGALSNKDNVQHDAPQGPARIAYAWPIEKRIWVRVAYST